MSEKTLARLCGILAHLGSGNAHAQPVHSGGALPRVNLRRTDNDMNQAASQSGGGEVAGGGWGGGGGDSVKDR